MKNIIVPVDGSETACAAARFAANLARETKGKLTLLYVYDAPAAAILGMNSLSPANIKKAEEELAKSSFEGARSAIDDPSVPIETHVTVGHPGNEIVGYAKSKSADLIVMGHRGLSNIQTVLGGSVSNFVVQHAHCPVTVVH